MRNVTLLVALLMLIPFTQLGASGSTIQIDTRDVRVVSGRSFWMSAKGSLDSDGKLEADVRIWSREALAGFTGRAVFTVRGVNGEILDVRYSDRYGVNGEYLPTAPADRTVKFLSVVPSVLAKAATHVEVTFERGGGSRNRLRDLLKAAEGSRLAFTDLRGGEFAGRSLPQEFDEWMERNETLGRVEVKTSPQGTEVTVSDDEIEIRVIGGEETEEFPGIGALMLNHKLHCTATAISPRVILTAAHCLYLGDVRVDGQLRFRPEPNVQGASTIQLYKIVAADHPIDFRFLQNGTTENDIAVAVLDRNLDVATIPLTECKPPTEDAVRNSDIAVAVSVPQPEIKAEIPKECAGPTKGLALLFVGYGYWLPGPKGPTGRKAKVNLPIRELDKRSFRYGIEGKNTCSGDSGGPALLLDPDDQSKMVIIGVTAYGDRACRSFGVDTRIDAHLDWIEPTAARLLASNRPLPGA